MRSLEYDISKQLARIDDINKNLEQTTYNYKSREALLLQCEDEIN